MTSRTCSACGSTNVVHCDHGIRRTGGDTAEHYALFVCQDCGHHLEQKRPIRRALLPLYEAVDAAAAQFKEDPRRCIWLMGRLMYHESTKHRDQTRSAEVDDLVKESPVAAARAAEMLRRGWEYEAELQEWGRIGDSGQ